MSQHLTLLHATLLHTRSDDLPPHGSPPRSLQIYLVVFVPWMFPTISSSLPLHARSLQESSPITTMSDTIDRSNSIPVLDRYMPHVMHRCWSTMVAFPRWLLCPRLERQTVGTLDPFSERLMEQIAEIEHKEEIRRDQHVAGNVGSAICTSRRQSSMVHTPNSQLTFHHQLVVSFFDVVKWVSFENCLVMSVRRFSSYSCFTRVYFLRELKPTLLPYWFLS